MGKKIFGIFGLVFLLVLFSNPGAAYFRKL